MKTLFLYLSILSLGCLLYACGGNHYASRYQEHDDVYFTNDDRTETERFASSSSSYLSEGYGQSKQSQQRNYSSAYQSNPTFSPNSNSNPDYSQQEGVAEDSTGAIVEYYRDNYVGFNNQNPTSGTFQGDTWNYQQPQYNMQMGMSPWGNNFGWQMGMPMGNGFGMGLGMGMGNGFYDPWGMNAWHRPWGMNSWYRPRGWNAWHNPWGWNQSFWGAEPVRRVVYRPRGSNLSSGSTMLNNPQNNNSYNVQNARRQRTYATGNRNEQTGTTSAISNSGRTRNRTSNNYTMGGNETYKSNSTSSYNNTQQRRSSSGMFYNNNQNNNSNRQSGSYQNNSNNNSSSYGSGSSGRSRSSSSSYGRSSNSSSGSSGYRSSGSSGRSSGGRSSGGRSGGGRSRP